MTTDKSLLDIIVLEYFFTSINILATKATNLFYANMQTYLLV